VEARFGVDCPVPRWSHQFDVFGSAPIRAVLERFLKALP
jgi:hypothetical protein